jgi:hypothetical protein
VAASTPNVLVYATSNRRHLLPEYMSENLTYKHTDDGEVHPGEGVEEKISLSERFGLWISFYPFSQDEYLTIAGQWLSALGATPAQIEAARPDALLWALERGSRSGRVAYQFARDMMGRQSDRPVDRARELYHTALQHLPDKLALAQLPAEDDDDAPILDVRPLGHGQFLAAVAPALEVHVSGEEVDSRIAELQRNILQLQALKT